MKKILLLASLVCCLNAYTQTINFFKGTTSNSQASYTGMNHCLRYFPDYGVVVCGNFDYGYNHVPPFTPIAISENIVALDSNGNFSSLGTGIHRPVDIQNLYYVDTIRGDLIAVGDIPGCLFRYNKTTSTWVNYNLSADSTVRLCLGVSHSKVLLVGDFNKINNVNCHLAALYDIDSNTVSPVNLFSGWSFPSVFANNPWRYKEKIYFTGFNLNEPIPVFNTNLLDVDTAIPCSFNYVRSIVVTDSAIYIAGLDGSVTHTISKYSNGIWSTFCNVQNNDCGLTYDAANKELYASGDFPSSCGYPCYKIFKFNEVSNQYSCVANNVENGFLSGMVILPGNKFYGLMGTSAICTNQAVTSINELDIEAALYLTPNPATNQLFIETNGTPVSEVNIYNTTGSLVSQTKQPQSKSIDVSNLATGVYIAEIKTKEGSVKKRWVKI